MCENLKPYNNQQFKNTSTDDEPHNYNNRFKKV